MENGGSLFEQIPGDEKVPSYPIIPFDLSTYQLRVLHLFYCLLWLNRGKNQVSIWVLSFCKAGRKSAFINLI